MQPYPQPQGRPAFVIAAMVIGTIQALLGLLFGALVAGVGITGGTLFGTVSNSISSGEAVAAPFVFGGIVIIGIGAAMMWASIVLLRLSGAGRIVLAIFEGLGVLIGVLALANDQIGNALFWLIPSVFVLWALFGDSAVRQAFAMRAAMGGYAPVGYPPPGYPPQNPGLTPYVQAPANPQPGAGYPQQPGLPPAGGYPQAPPYGAPPGAAGYPTNPYGDAPQYQPPPVDPQAPR